MSTESFSYYSDKEEAIPSVEDTKKYALRNNNHIITDSWDRNGSLGFASINTEPWENGGERAQKIIEAKRKGIVLSTQSKENKVSQVRQVQRKREVRKVVNKTQDRLRHLIYDGLPAHIKNNLRILYTKKIKLTTLVKQQGKNPIRRNQILAEMKNLDQQIQNIYRGIKK